jgi:hypothetical protein
MNATCAKARSIERQLLYIAEQGEDLPPMLDRRWAS